MHPWIRDKWVVFHMPVHNSGGEWREPQEGMLKDQLCSQRVMRGGAPRPPGAESVVQGPRGRPQSTGNRSYIPPPEPHLHSLCFICGEFSFQTNVSVQLRISSKLALWTPSSLCSLCPPLPGLSLTGDISAQKVHHCPLLAPIPDLSPEFLNCQSNCLLRSLLLYLTVDPTGKGMKRDHFLTPDKNQTEFKDWNGRPGTIGPLEENTGSTLFDISFSNDFFGFYIKNKNKHVGLHQTKQLLHSKAVVQKPPT